MKNLFISAMLLCAAGAGRADGMETTPAANGTATETSAPAAQRPHPKAVRPKHASMPPGDLRHCLDLNGNEAIIRCAEKPAKKP